MLKTLLALSVAAGLTVVFALPAQASDGTINFVGAIKDVTCTVQAAGTSGISTVTLPTITKSALTTVGATAGDTNFNIELTNCSGTDVSGSGVAVHFEPGVNVNANGRLTNNGAATGVDLALYETNAASPLNLGVAPTAAYKSMTGATPNGSATLPYTVKYYATSATPGAGTVTSSVVYSVVYF
ncbi:type 1 fimbrial protein [Pseudomonas sp. B21-040]|uniref:fimbrial protein n=1 Tax=Pseudomonas sp. B21-040 TaxID=2895486 RepID=UPI00215EC484|nr:fimbrial protein [Pseudomonas sp. B21-040]UVL43187.1 type 1 fimbrial protein [Pseudomonas sp. B21-040]